MASRKYFTKGGELALEAKDRGKGLVGGETQNMEGKHT